MTLGLNRRDIALTAWETFPNPHESEDDYLARLTPILKNTLFLAQESETSVVKKLLAESKKHSSSRPARVAKLFADFHQKLEYIEKGRVPFNQRLSDFNDHLARLELSEKLNSCLNNGELEEIVKMLAEDPNFSADDFNKKYKQFTSKKIRLFGLFNKIKRYFIQAKVNNFTDVKSALHKEIFHAQPWAQNSSDSANHLLYTKLSLFQMLTSLFDDFDSWIFDEKGEQIPEEWKTEWTDLKKWIHETHHDLSQTCPPFVFNHGTMKKSKDAFEVLQKDQIALEELGKKVRETGTLSKDDQEEMITLAIKYVYKEVTNSPNVSILRGILNDRDNYLPVPVTGPDTEAYDRQTSPVERALLDIDHYIRAQQAILEFQNYAPYSTLIHLRIEAIIHNWQQLLSHLPIATAQLMSPVLARLQKLNQLANAKANPLPSVPWKQRMKAHGYKFIKELGKGSIGAVSLWQRTTKAKEKGKTILVEEKFAIKELQKHILGNYQYGLLGLIGESTARIKDPHLTRVLGRFVDHEGTKAFAMEYVEAESNLLEHAKKTISYAEYKEIIINLLEAIKVLHDARRIQGDLKLDDILLLANNQVVLVDTSFQKILLSIVESMHLQQCSIKYCSPESVKIGDTPPNVSRASDIYSLGIILYALYANKFPYKTPALHPPKDQKAVDHYDWHEIRHQDLRQLIQRMVSYDSSKRPPIDEVLSIVKSMN